MEPVSRDSSTDPVDPAVVEQQIEAIERELKDVGATTQTLDRHITLVNEVMANPEEFLRIGAATSRLTRMGFKAEPESEDPGEEIAYTEFKIGGSKRFVGRLVRYPRIELVEPGRPPLFI